MKTYKVVVKFSHLPDTRELSQPANSVEHAKYLITIWMAQNELKGSIVSVDIKEEDEHPRREWS